MIAISPHARTFGRLFLAALLVGLSFTLTACDDDDSGTDLTQLVDDAGPLSWEVYLSPTAPEALEWTAEDVVDYLTGMGRTATLVRSTSVPLCEEGYGKVVLVGDGLGDLGQTNDPLTEQTWVIREEHCGPKYFDAGKGTVVTLGGGGLLGRQYAAYQWLHHLGVRYFHPEEEFVPAAPMLAETPLDIEHKPDFLLRSTSLHLTHPLELGDIFREGKQEYLQEALNYIDWQVKNLASEGHGGVGDGEYRDYGRKRGLKGATGFRLYGSQQGETGLIDPDDPRSEEQQIQDAIDARLQGPHEYPPAYFSVTYHETEFTNAPEDEVVRLLGFIDNYMQQAYPDVMLLGNSHGTGQELSETYGVRPNDLMLTASDHMGIRAHTLMFYDLFRPAPVYGNDNFNYYFDIFQQYYQRRKLYYFPEAAWWLTFDIGLPIYLPITIEARDRDIQGLAFMLESGNMIGHRTFGTGHEWGYWQPEYCGLRMSADIDYSWRDCIADIVAPMGPVGSRVQDIIEELVYTQERDFIYGDHLKYLFGTDDETEAAAAIGIEFHPLPPKPVEILEMEMADITEWETKHLPALQKMEQDNLNFVSRLNALESTVDPAGASLFREMRDGTEINGLRARHQWQVYGALFTYRKGQLLGDGALIQDALQLLEDAKASTDAVIQVVRRREQDYRYLPIERSIAGGPQGTDDDNWTIYNYRYLNRPHHGFYYKRIDGLAEDAINGAAARVATLEDAVLTTATPARIEFAGADLANMQVDFGDGTVVNVPGPGTVEHAYSAVGTYTVVASGTRLGQPFTKSFDVAVLQEEFTTGFTGKVVDPGGAVQIINPLLPGLAFGTLDGANAVIGVDIAGDGFIDGPNWAIVQNGNAAGDYNLGPADIVVPIVNGGQQLTQVIIRDGVLTMPATSTSPQIAGRLAISDLVNAIVSIGGFEPDGARRLIASFLGYTPETLPDEVSFAVEWELAP